MQITSPTEASRSASQSARVATPAWSSQPSFDRALLEATEGLGKGEARSVSRGPTEPAPAGRAGAMRLAASGNGGRPSPSFEAMVRVRADRWQGIQKLPTSPPYVGDLALAAPAGGAAQRSGLLQLDASASRFGEVVSAEPTPDVGGVVPSRPLAATRPMALSEFPRPANDNGRGIHWVPTLRSSPQVVDRFVQEAVDMKMKWVVLLNDNTNIGDNDYLVRKLTENGIMPVMRVYTHEGAPIQGDLEAMVRHYRALGVHYFQLYNEPNLICENQGQFPSVQRYLDLWIPAAKAVIRAGGLPGFAALAPGGHFDDLEFFKQAVDGVIQRGEVAVFDKTWISLHNYTLNHPLDHMGDSNGFLKFRWYNRVLQEKLGRSMPIIGTEGGTYVGAHNVKELPPITPEMQVQMVKGAYEYMRHAEPYFFVHTYWIIANEEGGGHDRSFSYQAMFTPQGPTPVVAELRAMP